MKAIFTSILVIVCFVVLVLGNISWNTKIKDAGANVTASENSLSENASQSETTKQASTITFDVTSTKFIAEGNIQDLIDLSADMIIFEALTLKDNGEVVIEDSHKNITTIMQAITDNNSNTSFILQPPPPLFSANFYPKQVEELKKFAEANNIMYLDYWSSFPAEETEDRASYFTENQDALNEDGYVIWSSYVENYLISN